MGGKAQGHIKGCLEKAEGHWSMSSSTCFSLARVSGLGMGVRWVESWVLPEVDAWQVRLTSSEREKRV